jgi:hypothetical protein
MRRGNRYRLRLLDASTRTADDAAIRVAAELIPLDLVRDRSAASVVTVGYASDTTRVGVDLGEPSSADTGSSYGCTS